MKILDRRILFVCCSVILFVSLYPFTLCASQHGLKGLSDGFFVELWNDNSYRKTNFGYSDPEYKEEDFYLTQLSLSTGMRFDVLEDIYIDARLLFDLVGDWGGEEWNDVYWNNMLTWGFGGRLGYDFTPDNDEEQYISISDITVELFADLLFSGDTLDGGNDNIPDEDASNNVRTGLSVWTSLDSKEFFSGTMNLWSEIGVEFAYESTGFSEENMDNYYLLTLDSLFGIQFPLGDIFLQPYYSVEAIRDFGDKQWNKEPWLNNATFGPGMRLSMGNLLPFEDADFYLYTEYLDIDYCSRVDSESYEYTAEDDFRAGIEIYIPIGATQDRMMRH